MRFKKFKKTTDMMWGSHPIFNWYRLSYDELEKSLNKWLSVTKKEDIVQLLIAVSRTMRRQWNEAIEIQKELNGYIERTTDIRKLVANLSKLRIEFATLKEERDMLIAKIKKRRINARKDSQKNKKTYKKRVARR